MHEDRFFDSDPSVRRLARTIYERTSALPIVSPHGHVDPRLLADDAPFPEPTALFILPDHYVLRMLYSQGAPLERLGSRAGVRGHGRFRARSAANLAAVRRSLLPVSRHADGGLARLPVRAHLRHHARRSTPDPAQRASTTRSPRSSRRRSSGRVRLFDRFRIEVLATTDAASDPLEQPRQDPRVRMDRRGSSRRSVRTRCFQIASPTWEDELARLEQRLRTPNRRTRHFIAALASAGPTSRRWARRRPTTASRRRTPRGYRDDEADALFQRARDRARPRRKTSGVSRGTC